MGADGPETAAEASSVLPFPVVLTAQPSPWRRRPTRGRVAVATLLRSPEEVRAGRAGAARPARRRTSTLRPAATAAPGPVAGRAGRQARRAGGRWWGWHRPRRPARTEPGTRRRPTTRRRTCPTLAAAVGARPGGRGRRPPSLVRDVRMACGRTAPVLWPAAAIERARGRSSSASRCSCTASPEIAEVELRPVVLDGEQARWWPRPGSVSSRRRAGDHPPLLRRLPG